MSVSLANKGYEYLGGISLPFDDRVLRADDPSLWVRRSATKSAKASKSRLESGDTSPRFEGCADRGE